MLEKIIKNAVLPVIASAFLLQGCAVIEEAMPRGPPEIHKTENGEPETNILNEEKRECMEYQIGEIKQVGYSLVIPVKKRKILETTIQKEIITPVYDAVYINSRLERREKIKDKREVKEEHSANELSPLAPAAKVIVKVGEDIFGFLKFGEAKTDAKGNATAKIIKYTKGWIASSADNYEGVDESVKRSTLKEKTLEMLTIAGCNELQCWYRNGPSSYSVEIEALPEGKQISTEKKKFEVKGWEIIEILPPAPYQNSDWNSWLDGKIKETIPTDNYNIEVKDYDTHVSISADITYTKKSGPTVQDAERIIKEIKDKYFNKNGPLYQIGINSSDYIKILSNNVLTGQVNIPSTYNIKSLNPNYYFVGDDVTFKKDSMKKTIYMTPKGASITVEDKRKGKIVDEETK